MLSFRAVNGTYLANQLRREYTFEAVDLEQATEILISKRYNAVSPVGVTHETGPPLAFGATQHQNIYMYVDGELAEHWNVQIQV